MDCSQAPLSMGGNTRAIFFSIISFGMLEINGIILSQEYTMDVFLPFGQLDNLYIYIAPCVLITWMTVQVPCWISIIEMGAQCLLTFTLVNLLN